MLPTSRSTLSLRLGAALLALVVGACSASPATRDGAPRIMMKPRDGASYWTEQLANLDRKGGYGQGKNRRGGGFERADRGGDSSDDNG